MYFLHENIPKTARQIQRTSRPTKAKMSPRNWDADLDDAAIAAIADEAVEDATAAAIADAAIAEAKEKKECMGRRRHRRSHRGHHRCRRGAPHPVGHRENGDGCGSIALAALATWPFPGPPASPEAAPADATASHLYSQLLSTHPRRGPGNRPLDDLDALSRRVPAYSGPTFASAASNGRSIATAASLLPSDPVLQGTWKAQATSYGVESPEKL